MADHESAQQTKAALVFIDDRQAADVMLEHQPRRLQGQFMHRIDTCPWVEAGMRRATGDDQLGSSRRFAQKATRV